MVKPNITSTFSDESVKPRLDEKELASMLRENLISSQSAAATGRPK